jgi:exodeoxyribonuclease VII large subunit
MEAPRDDVITVTELNRLARFALERALPIRWVAGEISNLTRAPSGHWYFTLKDAGASVRCAMFRNRNQFLDWRPENGMRVEAKAQATLYEARGDFQLSVEALRRAGIGALFEAFIKLKEKLASEGLFDAARKRQPTPYPRRLGIITSPRAAALRDVLTTLRRRWPSAALVLYPTLVQGQGAAARIANALTEAGARAECDTLLLVRGGGGIEDLWAFNEEVVARAIVASPIPVVTGIGHETDFTIADFVADLRAPTPTGAAQLATPDHVELFRRVAHGTRLLGQAQQRRLDRLGQRLDTLTRGLRHPSARIEARREHLARLRRRLELAQNNRLGQHRRLIDQLDRRLATARPRVEGLRQRIEALRARLNLAWRGGARLRQERAQALTARLIQLDPEAVLARGYSLVTDAQGLIIRDATQLRQGDPIDLRFARGHARARIDAVGPKPEHQDK